MRGYLYACSFSLDETGGKGRATRQKLSALSKQVDSLKVIGLTRFVWVNLLILPFVELYLCSCMLFTRVDVYISRGFVGIFSQWAAKLLGIVTVREVHADPMGEMKLQSYGRLSDLINHLVCSLQVWLDNNAQVRIFNHPSLMSWWSEKYGTGGQDVYVYNGADLSSVSNSLDCWSGPRCDWLERDDLLVFIGTASKWHGVDYLVNLQREFNRHGDPYQVVCAGGAITSEIDPEGLLWSLSPLDERGCSYLIRKAKAVLLPVKQSRVSPGSPLKLYDYLAHSARIITQQDVVGYDDEVEKYSAGFSVNFESPEKAREKIVRQLAEPWVSYDVPQEIDWEGRTACWLSALSVSRRG